MTLAEIFSSNLKRIMEREGITVGMLAEWCEVPDTTIYRWKNGVNVPRADGLVVLAKVLQVEPEAFFELEKRSHD